MKTKKNKNLVFLTAFLAIILALVSIVVVNKIMAKEAVSLESRSNSTSSSSQQKSYSGEKETEEIEKELKPEVKIEVREVVEEETKTVSTENEVIEVKEEVQQVSTDEKKVVEEESSSRTVGEISGEVEGAEEVEYRLVKKGSVEPNIYLGKAEVDTEEEEEEDDSKKEDSQKESSSNSSEKDNSNSNSSSSSSSKWSLEYDFSNVPVGEYDLYAEVRNQYGTYSSEKISLTVEEDDSLSEKVQLGQEGITIKVSSINNDDAGEKLKELGAEQLAIQNDTTLTEEEKELKLDEVEKEKQQIIEEFNFRNQIEEIYKKQSEGDLSEEDKKALEEVAEILKVDSDGDGLPDHEELRIGSNPFSADSDQDGYLDGDEVANGYDPLTPSTKEGIDKIVFDEPKNSGKENVLYQVEEVDFFEKNPDKGIEFKGRALPNSFITLYIYSSPVVVTVKTDDNGGWSYVLSKELEEGNHEVYAAVTDNTGKVTSKSKPLAFVKTAQAIEPIASAQGTGLEAVLSPVEIGKNNLFIFVILISIFSLVSAVTSIVLLVKHNRERLDN